MLLIRYTEGNAADGLSDEHRRTPCHRDMVRAWASAEDRPRMTATSDPQSVASIAPARQETQARRAEQREMERRGTGPGPFPGGRGGEVGMLKSGGGAGPRA